MHRRVAGELTEPAGRFPAGTPYAADDPVLLLWILATLVDSALLVYEKYVRRLTRDERDAYWQDYRVIGRLFGLTDDEMPARIEDFDAYMEDFLTGDDLFITDEARELAIRIVMRPPVPLRRARCSSSPTRSRSACCPRGCGGATGCAGTRCASVALHGGAEYVKRVVVPVLPSACGSSRAPAPRRP